jgi:hypothetical protein
MRAPLIRFAQIAAAIITLQIIAMGLFFAKALFPPTLLTGIAANLVYGGGPIGFLVIILFHLFLLAIVNIGLLGFSAPSKPRSLLAGIPSLLWTSVLFGLSLRYWARPIAHSRKDGALGGIQAGLQLQGPVYVYCYLALNLVVLAGTVVALAMLLKKRAPAGDWLVYNAALQGLLCFVLFPWLGGLP